MVQARSLLLVGAAAWLAACAETSGPSRPQSPLVRAEGQLHQLQWQPRAAPRAFAVVRTALTRTTGQMVASAPVTLDQNQVSFWAFPDREQGIRINYLAADGTWQPYVDFVVPQGALAQWPDGSAIAPTDSVLITASVDTVSLVVRFQPTGLVFNPLAPAHLTVWYTDANPDFDASGVVDGTDSYIEQNLLGVWVQEYVNDPWSQVTATQYIPGKMFSADLGHFSDYAVSW